MRSLKAKKERLDALRLSKMDVFAELGYVPTAKQQEFHDATEDDILYGGAAGGGKTLAIVMEALRACVRHPGIRVLILRRTYDELAESLYPEFQRLDWGAALGAKWNKTDKEITFPNRSVIRLRYMDDPADASRRQGGGYQLLLVDERTLMPPGLIDIIALERLRSAHGVPVIGVRSTSNPGGPSHGEVRERYVEPTDHGERTVTNEHGLTLRFIPALATDNPHLDADYHRRLDSIPDPARRAAMRDGDWGQFAGQMFTEYRRDRHTLAPITLPATWSRYNGVDWGYTKPWAVLWGAVDEDGRVWVYREIYETGVGESAQAEAILDAEADGESVAVRYADDAMWATRGEAKPIASIYAENGVHLTPAGKGPGSRIAGWQRWHTYLKEGPACPHHRALGWETCPMIHIFRTCKKLLWELENLPHATKGNPEDADTTAPDHACLVAGTFVRTARGDTPIESVEVGDLVWTRNGLRPVVAAGITARGAVVGSVLLSSGATLRGTANHPVWVRGYGWKPLSALAYSDKLEPWRTAKPRSSTASSSADIRTPRSVPTGSTSRPGSQIGSAESSAFTKKSGRPQTGRYPMAITSITGMGIRPTTTSATSNACSAASTWSITGLRSTTPLPSAWPTWIESGRSLRSGTAPTRAVLGIRSTRGSSSPSASRLRASAPSAGPTTSPWGREGWAVSAATTAKRSGARRPESTTRIVSARAADRASESTSTPRPQYVGVSAVGRFVEDEQRADVYNLSVRDAPEFYANGVLVHNCDAGRYLLLNLGTGPEFLVTPDTADTSSQIQPLKPLGKFARRLTDEEQLAEWAEDDDGPGRGATQLSPFA